MSFNRVISDTGLRLGPVRFSYANVFRPRTNDDGTPGKYSLCVIIPKSDTEAYNMLKKAYEAAVALGKTTKWNGRVPSKVALPIHDGDDERPDDEDREEEKENRVDDLANPDRDFAGAE